MSFENLYHVSESKTIQSETDENKIQLEKLYQSIRDLRVKDSASEKDLISIFEALKTNHKSDWLLALEILELSEKFNFSELQLKALAYLNKQKTNQHKIAHLIKDGIEIINKTN